MQININYQLWQQQTHIASGRRSTTFYPLTFNGVVFYIVYIVYMSGRIGTTRINEAHKWQLQWGVVVKCKSNKSRHVAAPEIKLHRF